MSINDAYLQALRASGIQIHQGALGEIVIQTTALRTEACARYTYFSSRLNAGKFDAKGVALLNLVRTELIFSPTTLVSMSKGNYKLYKLDEHERCIDWQFDNGWRDRRFLSSATTESLLCAGFPCISPAGLRAAREICGGLNGDQAGIDPLLRFMADAVAWWSDHIPGPLLSHALGFGKYQLLRIESWARLYAKEPQIRIESSAVSESEKHLELIEGIERRTSNLQSMQSFMISVS